MRYAVKALAIILTAAVPFVLAPTSGFAAGKKADREEQQVSMDQVPEPVKAALEKEAKGGTIGTITQETQKGKTFYEAEVEKNGKKRFVHVAADGKVVKRESAKREAKEEKGEK
jgi:hypothetical protein